MEQNIGDLIKNVEWREVSIWNIFELKKTSFGSKLEKYISNEKQKGYIPYLSSGLANNQISGYVKKEKLKNEQIYNGGCLSWTANATGMIFYRNEEEFAIKSDAGVLKFKEEIRNGDKDKKEDKESEEILGFTLSEIKKYFNYKYIYYSLIGEFEKKGFDWDNKATNEKVKKISFLIPYKNGKPDINAQQKIANFIDNCFDKLDNADKYLQLIFQSVNQKRGGGDVIDKNFLNTNFEDILKKHDEKIAKLEKLEKDKQKRNFKDTVMKGNLIDNLWKSILEGVFDEAYLKEKFNGVEWEKNKSIENIIDNKKRKKYKFDVIKENEILNSGKYPVISQGDDYINGYSTNEEKLFKGEFPLLAFGDHTFNIKYIDFEFIPSGDGLKNLYFIKNINYKYVYYFIYMQKGEIEGYQRHFKILKSLKIPIPYKNGYPDTETQQEIVAILEKAFIYYQRMKNKAESNQKYLQNMRKGILTNIFETANLLSNQK